MKEFTADKIELINAYGPYNHSVWTYEGLRITNEEKLAGRVELIAGKIRECILKNFTMDEIGKMSLVDIGCYDGWILQALSDLPFAEIVGIEPRESNITKARMIRELLNIKSRIKFEIGDIDSLGDKKFDIVICTGLLHHLESIPSALHKRRSVCRRMLFLESIFLSSRHLSRSFREEMEMKDIAYFNRKKVCGITGQKFESSYYDGSTNKLAVVSIPSIESLLMYLEIAGFSNVQTVIDPKSYNSIWKKERTSLNAIVISALPGEAENMLLVEESSWIESYELGLAKTILDRKFIEPLYNLFHRRKFQFRNPLFFFITFLYIRSPNWASAFFLRCQKTWFKDRYALEIIKNLKFNPDDKLSLEYGKILYKAQAYQEAISVLKDVTRKLNADWRSVYRSFYLLSRIYKEMGQEKESEHYQKLCLISNSRFPIRSEGNGSEKS